MEEIAVPYHLAIPSLICIAGLLVIIFNRKSFFAKDSVLFSSLTVFLIFYLLIVGTATFDSLFYQWDLNRYDLNQDGMFSGQEITTEQNEAMRKLTSDTGRNFSFIIGFIAAFSISTIVYVGGKLYQKTKQSDIRK